MRVLGIGVILSLFALSCGTGRLENPNPYPCYCTEEPGRVWGQVHYSDVAMSPDGEIIAFVYSGNPYGNPPGKDTIGIFFYFDKGDSFKAFLTGLIFTGFPLPVDLDFSPDSDWFVFSWGRQIWKIKVNGDSLTQLTFSGENFYPRWSPDGRKISFHKIVPVDSSGIWIMNADGSKKTRVIKGYEADWSPGGKYLIFSGLGGSLYRVDTSGGNMEKILDIGSIGAIDHLSTPIYSPDGLKILFVAQRPHEGPMVWVMNADGSNPVPLAWGKHANWSNDGEKILYTRPENGDIWIMDQNGCNKTPLIGDFNFLEGGER